MAEPTDPFAPLGPEERAAAEHARMTDTADTEWQPILPAPLSPPSQLRHREHGRPAAVWQYLARDGRLLFLTARFNIVGGKEVLPMCCGADKWRWKAPPVPRPLYGLDRLAARPDAVVLLVEGEKTADAAQALFPAAAVLTWQGGAKAIGKADWRYLKGRRVVMWPDADVPGLGAVQDIAERVGKVGAAGFAAVTLPGGLPEGWDLADELPPEMSPAAVQHMFEEAEARAASHPAEPAKPAEALPDFSTPEARQAEIIRLSLLLRPDYSAARKPAAQALGMGVGDLDRAVKAERGARRAKAEEDYRNQPPPAGGEVRWPFGFFTTAAGLFADVATDAAPIWLAPPFEVIGLARDAQGGSWGTWLRWGDKDGTSHTWLMANRMLVSPPGDLEGAMLAEGLAVDTGAEPRALLRRALGGIQTDRRARIATRAGWHEQPGGGVVFLLADGSAIGEALEPVILSGLAENAAKMAAVSGTLESWQTAVAALAIGNPIAAFCIAAAFAGPMLDVLGEPSGGFHLFGKSKSGKTMALRMGCSVWGFPFKGGQLRDWRSTANALEAAAEEASDGLLALDEIHQAMPADVAGAVYTLANEAGRGRLRRDSSAQRRRTWRTLIMSTGEIDVGAMVARANEKLPAGAQVRLPSLPVGSDPWPELHGETDFQALSAAIHAGLRGHHGSAGRKFVADLAEARGEEPGQIGELFAQIQVTLEGKLPAEADPQVRDVVRRFALVATAGELARQMGILPWVEGEATQAAEAMLRRWMAHRGNTSKNSEARDAVERVKHFILSHGASRFVLLRENDGGALEEVNPGRPVVNRVGWSRPVAGGRFEYLIGTSAWREDLCAPEGLDPVEAKRALDVAGFLIRGDGANMNAQRTIPGMGKKIRVVAVSSLILEG